MLASKVLFMGSSGRLVLTNLAVEVNTFELASLASPGNVIGEFRQHVCALQAKAARIRGRMNVKVLRF